MCQNGSKHVKYFYCIYVHYIKLCQIMSMLGVVPCTCNPATLDAEFRNRVGLIPVGGNSPLIGGWIV